MHDTLTDAEKAKLLADLGMTGHAEAFSTPAPVIEAVIETVEPVNETDAIAADLLKKAKGNMDTAKQLSENWAKAEFDKVKLSKVQAAALGVDKSKHNSDEYKRIQGLRERINSAMRKQTRGHVATKIAANTRKADAPERTPELDAFLLANQGNPIIEQLLKLQGGTQ